MPSLTCRPAALRAWTVRLALALVVLPVVAQRAAAQDKVYDLTDVTTLPKLSSSAQTARLIQSSYPSELKKNGIGGTVDMEFIVGKDGKVEASTIEVNANVPALGAAAKAVAEKLEFQPAQVKGAPVRARVVLPLVFKP
ncbi:MAG: energy transducer TonB [Gemmatimonadetes bacterium]|nr:energy transducer TonB [Gemmatimonadota bacterium]